MSMNDLLSDLNKGELNFKGNEGWASIPGIPNFNHSEVLHLYAWGFDIPAEAVRAILSLPRESLIADLELVLQDAEQRYPTYLAAEEGKEPLDQSLVSFPSHAIFLLAELGANACLGKVCRFLGKDPSMVNYWLEGHIGGDLWLALFKLGKDNLERLQKFARNHDADAAVRSAITSAVAQVAWHYSGRRKEVIVWFESFFNYFLENFRDDSEAAMLGEAISDVASLRTPDLLDAIENLFAEDLVDSAVCGSFLEIQGDMYEPVNNWAKMPIKGIYEIYQHYTDTWAAYADAGEDDDAELLSGGAYMQGKDKNKSLASFNPAAQPVKKDGSPGRNDLCPCGSGKKYKKCHGV